MQTSVGRLPARSADRRPPTNLSIHSSAAGVPRIRPVDRERREIAEVHVIAGSLREPLLVEQGRDFGGYTSNLSF